MKKLLSDALLLAGASDVGVCRARIYDEISEYMKKTVDFSANDYQKRINPFLIMPSAKSVIVFVVSYKSGLSGNISSYAYGRDYHAVTNEIADAAIKILEQNGYGGKSFSDTGDLCDRHLAYLAGLGFLGKNHMLIHPKFGSFIFIGYILTDCPLKEDSPLEKSCIDCGKCIESCPSGALSDNDFSKCLSHLTQKKGELSENEKALIKKGELIWGCDICQKVCPYNKNAPDASNPAFCSDLITELDIGEMSNREFLRKFKDRAFSWRGKNVIKRNIDIKNEND